MSKKKIFIILGSILGVAGATAAVLKFTVFTNKKYIVSFNGNGGTLKSGTEVQEVSKASEIVAPTYERQSYRFIGWDKDLTTITSTTTVKAQWEHKTSFTVTWKNYDGTVLEVDENVKINSDPSYDANPPIKPSSAEYHYVFSGWSPNLSPVTSDITYIAQYSNSKRKYTVTWKNHDGTVLETDNDVPYGTTPTFDSPNPTKEPTSEYQYEFSGWSPKVAKVTGDVTYTAQFTQETRKYTVTWKNYNDEVLEIDKNVEKGSTPSYDGETPIRPSQGGYFYVFNGWSPDIETVAGDQEYTAQYISQDTDACNYSLNSDQKSYTVTGLKNNSYTDVCILNEYNGYPVTAIKDEAFRSKTSLSSITIPNSITSIGSGAFRYCSSLKSITIPSSVTSIGDLPLLDCTSLTSINVDKDNKFYDSRNDCNALIETSTNNLISGCNNTVIPNNITKISTYAFSRCSSLKSITIPSCVTSIGSNAFNGCTSLTSVTIPNIETINTRTFFDCESLSSVSISDGVTLIDESAFEGCSSLKSLSLPGSVVTIGKRAFFDCSSLPSISITNKVTTIGDNAFCGCSSLTSLFIPSSVTSIGNSAFSSCISLTSISVDNGNTVYNSRNNCNAIIETTTNKLIIGCINTTIPDGVTSIGESVFANLTNLKSITIPNSVTTIGKSAFCDCSSLQSITLPTNLITIDNYAFEGCYSLTSIIIPNGVTSIGVSAFENCRSLETLSIPASLTSIGSNAFLNCGYLGSITVDSANTVYDSRNSCNAIIEKATNKLILGSKNAVIPNTVKTIGKKAFYGCSSITSISIPSSVTSIEWGAFQNCYGLTSITLPSNVSSLGWYAFYNCLELKTVIIQKTDAIVQGGDYMFGGSNDLANGGIYVPSSLYYAYIANDYWAENKTYIRAY